MSILHATFSSVLIGCPDLQFHLYVLRSLAAGTHYPEGHSFAVTSGCQFLVHLWPVWFGTICLASVKVNKVQTLVIT